MLAGDALVPRRQLPVTVVAVQWCDYIEAAVADCRVVSSRLTGEERSCRPVTRKLISFSRPRRGTVSPCSSYLCSTVPGSRLKSRRRFLRQFRASLARTTSSSRRTFPPSAILGSSNLGQTDRFSPRLTIRHPELSIPERAAEDRARSDA